MSEEWDEVKNEVKLTMERLRAFRDDLWAAEKSGALTELECAFVNVAMGVAIEAAVRIEKHMEALASVEAAKEGEAQE